MKKRDKKKEEKKGGERGENSSLRSVGAGCNCREGGRNGAER
jgi:hypothetical protein